MTAPKSGRQQSAPYLITTAEHKSVEIPYSRLNAVGTDRLKQFKTVRGVLSARPGVDGWEVRTQAAVGVVDLGSVRLVVEPKIAITGERLMTWLGYATGSHLHHFHEGKMPHTLSPTGYNAADLIVEALVEECHKLLRIGLRREYLRERVLTPQARGRIDVSAQATREYGQANRFHTSGFRQAATTWENEICALALRRAVNHAADPALKRAAEGLAQRFPGLSTGHKRPEELLRMATYTRLNRHYRPAHAWASVLLNTGGVADLLCTSGYLGRTMLLNMNTMWERAVQQMAADAAGPLGGIAVRKQQAKHLEIAAHGDVQASPGQQPRPFMPDCVVRIGNGSSAFHVPVDAKYYTYGSRRVEPDNVHQMMTYVSGYCRHDRRIAVLVYPSTAGPSLRTLEVRNAIKSLGRIHVLGVDVNVDPQVGVEQVRQALLVVG